MAWKIGLAANLVVAVAYIGVAYAIARPPIDKLKIDRSRRTSSAGSV